MKRVLALFLTTIALTGCPHAESDMLSPRENLIAYAEIVWSEQAYGYVTFDYTVENLGAKIDYYELYYDMISDTGDVYSGWTNGISIAPDTKVLNSTMMYVGEINIVSIELTDLLLWQW